MAIDIEIIDNPIEANVDVVPYSHTIKGEDGKDGYTPVKGIDYFDGKDGKDGVDGYTPIKGVDYRDGIDGKDGKDGYTPIKGVDYRDGIDGKNGADGINGKDGKDGTNGKDGISATHSWNGTTLTITSASGTSSANLKGEKGDKGADGTMSFEDLTPEQKATLKGDKGDKGDPGLKGEKGDQGIQGIPGEKGADGKDGKDGLNGVNGTNGVDGKDGKDGTSVTHEWNGTVLTITSASGTSSADLKGEKGDPGSGGGIDPDLVLTTMEEINANTNETAVAGALAVKEALGGAIIRVNNGVIEWKEQGADSFIPFKSGSGGGKYLLGAVYTDDYKGREYVIKDSNMNEVGRGNFDSDGYALVYTNELGTHYVYVDDSFIMANVNVNNLLLNGVPLYFFSASKGSNKLDRILEFVGKNSGGNITKTQEKITLFDNSGTYYTTKRNTSAYVYVDVTNMQKINITISRSSTSGRVYLYACNENLSNANDISLDNYGSTYKGVCTYITDATAKRSYSINVSSFSGYYYVGLINCASSNYTYIHEWDWS